DSGMTPAIVPMFDTVYGDGGVETAVYYREEVDWVLLTWEIEHETKRGWQTNLAQMKLTAAGDIFWQYPQLDFPEGVQFAGIQPGGSLLMPPNISLAVDEQMVDRVGGREIFNLGFAQQQDLLFRPIVYLILLMTLAILLLFPAFVYVSLARPLQRLVAGIEAVNAGDLETKVAVQYHDEIGFLTASFNEMVGSIREAYGELVQTNKAYSRFVPVEVLTLLDRDNIIDVELGDQTEMEMSILFADVRNFTTLSEQMTPKENFDFINRLLGEIGPLIREHGGFIDKYMGDGIMALFPGSAEAAVRAGLALQAAVVEFNAAQGLAGEAIGLGVGIHTGWLMLGTIGEAERMEGTVISDTVNTASRLEGLTKQYGVGVIVSEAVKAKLGEGEGYRWRFLDEVQVKGKREAVGVYEVWAE
ncbi:MAG TPA: adenylate/guanylate cyclase domain-containing protein, partial [Anaerolineae bacterium]|nr:adenylate/guanylate cyclase domain-containing protein [Anaerolineae bacterium]